jgi:hypothetical protein
MNPINSIVVQLDTLIFACHLAFCPPYDSVQGPLLVTRRLRIRNTGCTKASSATILQSNWPIWFPKSHPKSIPKIRERTHGPLDGASQPPHHDRPTYAAEGRGAISARRDPAWTGLRWAEDGGNKEVRLDGGEETRERELTGEKELL